MRATIILVLLALKMSMTIEVDGLAFSPEQTNEDMASEVSAPNDEDLPEDEKLSNSLKYMEGRRVLHSLQHPGDCKTKTLINFAKKCGLKVVTGPHWKVYDSKTLLTVIPHKLKGKGTCIEIIKKLNGRCA